MYATAMDLIEVRMMTVAQAAAEGTQVDPAYAELATAVSGINAIDKYDDGSAAAVETMDTNALINHFNTRSL